MSAKIDGTQWTAATVTATKAPIATGLPFGTLAVSGTSSVTNRIEIVAFAVPAAVGTYTLGPAGGAATPQNASLQNTTTGAAWNATAGNGSGTITVSALTLTGASGSFAFNLTPLNTVAAGTKVVTEGAFDVAF